MTYFKKPKRKNRFKQQVAIAVLFAVVAGGVIGILLPNDIENLTGADGSIEGLEEISGNAVVVDGDTIRINETTIRLFGIDAPEAKQTCYDDNSMVWDCGIKSSALLTSLVENKSITCKSRDIDQYNRLVAVCMDGEIDLNGLMVSNGMAVAYRDYSSDYIDEETEAKSSSRGLWAGKFEYPWNFRAINRYINSDVVSNGCNIKGNINSRGVRIYHVPGGEYYSVTQINPSNGEKWFCSESEARLAGWRRSRV